MALDEADVDELRELHRLRQSSGAQYKAGLQLLARHLGQVTASGKGPGLVPRATFFKTLARARQRGELTKSDEQVFDDLVGRLCPSSGQENLEAQVDVFGLRRYLEVQPHAGATSDTHTANSAAHDAATASSAPADELVVHFLNGDPKRKTDKQLTLYHHAKLLQALASHPATLFGRWMFAAYYRVILGLYCTGIGARPGEAREGHSDQASAFLTNECVTGLLALRKPLKGVSRLLSACERLGRAEALCRNEARTELRGPSAATTQAIRIRCTIAAQQTGAVRVLSRPRPLQLATILTELRKQAEKAVAALTQIERDLRSASQPQGQRQGDLQLQFAKGTGRLAVTESRKKVQRFQLAIRHAYKARKTPRLTRALQAAQDIIEDIISDLDARLRPCAVFAGNALDEHISRAELNARHPKDAAELISAAAILGYTVSWEDERVSWAFGELCEQVSLEGIFTSFRPLSVDGVKGDTRTIISAQTLRTLSMVGKHAPAQRVAVASLKKMLRLSEHTRVCPKNGSTEGWRHELLGNHAQQEWWVTGHMVSALGAFARMLDHTINRLVCHHFHVRDSKQLKVGLDDLLYPDWALSAERDGKGPRPKSAASLLMSMRLHLSGLDWKFSDDKDLGEVEGTWSAVLHGPPGTGKTTLVEAIAKSSGNPLIEVTPSDLVLGGERDVEARARNVFLLLSMLTDAVILFDEFDQLLQRRDKSAKTPDKIYEFLTPGMLPKLKQLHSSAKEQRVVYALSTNRIDSLDEAAIREGRFDNKLGVYPTDSTSRALHLRFLLPSADERRALRSSNSRQEGGA